MNFKFKRTWSIMLAALMVFTMVPMFVFSSSAATSKDFSGCTVADLGLSATDANGNGSGENAPECSWTASGTNINGSLVGGKDPVGPQTYYYESTSTLTITNNKTSEAELSFKYSVTTSGSTYGDITVNGAKKTSSTTGEVSETLAAGAKITVVLHVPERKKFSLSGAMPDPNGASISITDIKLVAQGNATINFAAAENGSYTVSKADGTAVTVPGSVAVKTTDRLTMTATPASGYVFSGWYNVTTGKYLSADLTYTTLFESDATVTAKFMKQADGVYGVGNAVFTDLTAAATAAAASSAKTVVLLKSATLTGSHTIPMGVTLLIPYDAAHTLSKAVPVSETVNHSSTSAENYVKYEKPSAFRTLTMTDGSELIIEGEMSVNAKHESCVGGQIYGGQVLGKYGEIKMNDNSKITVKNGATVYAWGYIWGSGSVEALSGATIYEKMQVTDYRGGSNTSVIALRNGWGKSDGAFPFNQYYIQNIEVKEILHEGAKLMAHAAVNLSGETPAEAAVEFIGSSSAMFTVQGAVITKEYHPETDRLSLSVDGDENSYCEINGMKLSMGTLSIDSANYTLPINSNIDININAGTAVVNQELVLQPGVKVVVGSDAMLANNANVYIMDLDQWGEFVFSGKRQQAVVYTPSLNKASTRTINSDAVMDINGYVMPIAGVYTTAGGAQIISSEKSGIVEFGADAPGNSTVAQLTGGSDVNNISVTPAQLKNGGLSGTTFVATSGAKEGAVYGYCSNCDVWADENHVCTVKYEITWKDKDGKTLYSTEVEEGTTPSFNNDNYITVPKGHSLVYTPAIVKATANTTYTVSVNPCVDTDKDHACDYGCGFTTSHSDENYDHICDFCKNSFSDHKDDDKNCICDYSGCKEQFAHNPGTAVIENEVKPNCTNNGSYDNVTYCTVCGTETSRETITVDALGHKAGEVVKEKEVAPDCTNDGSYDNVTYCTVCNEELSRKTVTVSANGHAWDEGVIDPQPTCNDEGVKTFTCGTCGKTKTETVSAKGHSNIIDVDAVAPTCTSTGLTAGKKCGVCGEFTVAQQEVPATGHTPNDAVTENEKEADCENDGYYDTVVYCTVCNAELSREKITVPALGHDMGGLYETVEPTCTENGEERSDCSRCDYYETFEIDSTGHEYNEVVTDPTCTEEGYTTYTCGACGDTYKNDTAPALGHTDGAAVVENNIDPDCETDGSYDTVVYCTVCNAELSRETITVPALGHDYKAVVTAPSCIAQGYTTYTCSCGDTYKDNYVDPLGHTWDEGVIAPEPSCTADGTKTFTCGTCGDTKTEAVSAKGHTAGEAVIENNVAPTCTADGSYDTVVYCSVCKDELSRETTTVTTNGHAWDEGVIDLQPTCNDEGVKTFTCGTCGETKTEAVSAKGHSNIIDVDAVAPTCTSTGLTAGKKCGVCGEFTVAQTEVPALGHKAGEVVVEDEVEATCEDEGSYCNVVYCTVCNEELSHDTITVPALGHKAGEVVKENEVKPDCTNKGSYDNVTYCTVCGDETSRETITVDALGHGSEEGFDYVDNKNGTHNVICKDCTETISENVKCSYDKTTHKCVCYAVETFTVTLKDYYEVNEYGTLEIPYGAKVFDYLKNVVVEDFEFANSYMDGVFSFSGDWYKESTKISEEFTMPGEDITLLALMYFTGWQHCGNDNWSYAIKDEAQTGWHEIDGEWYYFNPEVVDGHKGLRARGITRVPYPTEEINGVSYGANADDKAYWESHKGTSSYTDAETAMFVFGEDGKFKAVTGIVDGNRYAVKGMIGWHPGLVEIDGDYYYFLGDKNGGGNVMATGDTYVTRGTTDEFVNGGIYTFGEDGKLCEYDGITEVDGVLRYYKDNRLATGEGLIKVDGDYYYVRTNGELTVNAKYWVSKVNDYSIVAGEYLFDESGKLINPIDTEVYNGIIKIDGNYYYYINGKKQANTGVQKLTDEEGKTFYIYVTSGGKLATGDYWPTKHNNLLDRGCYNWGTDGKYYPTVPEKKDGIVEIGGKYYYYINGKKQANTGVQKLTDENGDTFYIYVRSNGELATGNYWPTKLNNLLDRGNYNWGTDGKYYPPAVTEKNGIMEVDGKYYYYIDGKMQFNTGVQKLTDENGKEFYIYVRSNGELATGDYWPTNRNNLLDRGCYNWGSDGRYYPA